jgi:hypothetical protein
MAEKEPEEALSDDELEEANGEPLPDREEMSILNPDPIHTLPVEPPATE